jgi:hypothetical protein
MRRNVLIAFLAASSLGALLGASCTTAQPPLECGFNPGYVGWYTLTSTTTPGGSCTTYEADNIQFAKYLPPVPNPVATFAVMSQRLGLDTRTDPCDPTLTDAAANQLRVSTAAGGRESVLGTFTSVYPNADGVCTAPTSLPALQSFPAVNNCADGDGGVFAGARTLDISETWTNFKLLNTARFVSVVFEADIALSRTEDGTACNAKYHVYGIFPPVACSTDYDCNPNVVTNPDGGRTPSVGSGLLPDYNPKCHRFSAAAQGGYEGDIVGPGLCLPTSADGGVLSLDEISKLP